MLKYKFRHDFCDLLNRLYMCSVDTKTTTLFLVLSFLYENQTILISDLENRDQSLCTLRDMNLVDLLLYDNEQFNNKNNYAILMCTI